jgi:hypothetical protein
MYCMWLPMTLTPVQVYNVVDANIFKLSICILVCALFFNNCFYICFVPKIFYIFVYTNSVTNLTVEKDITINSLVLMFSTVALHVVRVEVRNQL